MEVGQIGQLGANAVCHVVEVPDHETESATIQHLSVVETHVKETVKRQDLVTQNHVWVGWEIQFSDVEFPGF